MDAAFAVVAPLLRGELFVGQPRLSALGARAARYKIITREHDATHSIRLRHAREHGEIGKRAVYSQQRRKAATPSAQYHVIALDSTIEQTPWWMRGVLQLLSSRASVGVLHGLPMAVYDMERRMLAAFRSLQSGSNTGKVVIRIPTTLPPLPSATHLLTGGSGEPAAPAEHYEPAEATLQLLVLVWSVVTTLKKQHGGSMHMVPGTAGRIDQQEARGYAPDDESWRTQRKKLNQVELPSAARKRVLRDLRRMKQLDEHSGLELEDSECMTDWVVKLVGRHYPEKQEQRTKSVRR